jgi:hypothetical protein
VNTYTANPYLLDPTQVDPANLPRGVEAIDVPGCGRIYATDLASDALRRLLREGLVPEAQRLVEWFGGPAQVVS